MTPPPLIVPTARALVLAVLAAPLALVVAALAPTAWIVAPALAGALLLLVVADALAAGRLADVSVTLPEMTEIGAETRVAVAAGFSGSAQRSVEAALASDPRLFAGGRLVLPLSRAPDGMRRASGVCIPTRRGAADVSRLWLRWTGPLGLGARHLARPLDRLIRIRPNLAAVRSPALQTFLKDAQFGLIARRMRGEGTQFEALSEYRPGMDRRRIDWKSSARHMQLYAKEFETERNTPIVFAFDCGQAMCEPVGGVPRIDRAVSAALATAWVALKGGDRVAFYGFAARPETMSPFATDTREFRLLQSAAADLDYHAQEPNFTLAMATLASRLQRRSLIVVFSDFTDPTSAELMIESVGRLVARHVVLFVTLADEELEGFASANPASVEHLSMAVTANSLLRQRALVIRRLRQLGVDVIEAPWAQVGTRLIDAYLAIKRTGVIG